MKILICAPFDELVAALRAKGHEAYTCYLPYTSVDIPHEEWHIYTEMFTFWGDKLLDGDCCFKTSAGAEHYIEKWDIVFIPDYLLERYIKRKISHSKKWDKVFIIPGYDKVEEVLKELVT